MYFVKRVLYTSDLSMEIMYVFLKHVFYTSALKSQGLSHSFIDKSSLMFMLLLQNTFSE